MTTHNVAIITGAGLVTMAGDITESATAGRIVDAALDRGHLQAVDRLHRRRLRHRRGSRPHRVLLADPARSTVLPAPG
jgi:hypothetical protein